ncbi:MAG TPA: tetratricopeptide repeat protein, partial [Candidatus Saccharimonadales bacterium]|nr:tetratricopeptide repeat protein [Candidatus Saccharimonadales bacterium]
PVIFFITSILVTALVGFFATRYVLSDVSFQNSLLAAQQNNGLKTYQEQANSINTFPYRDAYYRIFSQTNLALANSLAASQPKNSSPSAQTQQNIYTLIQQSINAGRTATTLSPLTALNWQNLSSVYRNLIGFGQNADAFAVLTNQQAIGLDPNNPQEYVNLGGIYYQLGQWDNAINQFLIAIRLKNDYANAYYNLGHAYEQKGDLQNALAQYQTVRTLVASDANNLKQINAEIDSLQKKIGKTAAENGGAQTGTGNQQPLEISTPSAQLPQQKTPVKIPSPPASSSAR